MTISVWNLKEENFLLMFKLQRAAMVWHNVVDNKSDLKESRDKLRRLAAAMVEIVKDWKGFQSNQGALEWIDKEVWSNNVGCKFKAAEILDGKFYKSEESFMYRLRRNHGDLPRDDEIG